MAWQKIEAVHTAAVVSPISVSRYWTSFYQIITKTQKKNQNLMKSTKCCQTKKKEETRSVLRLWRRRSRLESPYLAHICSGSPRFLEETHHTTQFCRHSEFSRLRGPLSAAVFRTTVNASTYYYSLSASIWRPRNKALELCTGRYSCCCQRSHYSYNSWVTRQKASQVAVIGLHSVPKVCVCI